jgi:hypothetical protein
MASETQLLALSTSELSTRAKSAGVAQSVIDKALDAPSYKQALVDILMDDADKILPKLAEGRNMSNPNVINQIIDQIITAKEQYPIHGTTSSAYMKIKAVLNPAHNSYADPNRQSLPSDSMQTMPLRSIRSASAM